MSALGTDMAPALQKCPLMTLSGPLMLCMSAFGYQVVMVFG